MKKLILLVALLSASAVMAQGSRYETIVLDQSGHPVPGAIFTVCSNAGTGTPCTPTVNVYLDQALTIIANPSGFLTADSNGNIGFWAATGTYFYTITGTGLNGRTGYISLGGSGGGGSNFAVKPALGDGVEFVTSSAAGDGLSWGTAHSNADAGVAINAAIQALPTQGGVVNVSSKATSCYQFSTAIAFDRPVELIGSGGGYNGRSACLIWAGGASPMVTMTASSGLATGSKIENMGFISGGTCTWMLDIDNGTYEPTLRDVYFDSQGTACSAGGVRIGNNTGGSPVQSVNFDHVHIFGQPTNLQLLQLNSFQCNMCEISLATTGNVQIGDSTHLATAIRFNGGNVETDTGTVPSFIVNNVEGLTINSPYAETDGGNWMQIPNTATEASGVVVLGGRFQGNGVAANIFDINLAGASLTVDGASSFNYPLTSNWVNNHAGTSMYVALRDLKQDNTNMSYATGNAAAMTYGPGISGGSVIGAAIPSLTISCFANGGLGSPCVSLTIPSSLGDLVTSTKFYSPSDAGLPFGSQTTPIVMNVPALTNTETARVFSLTNNGIASCNWGIRVDGDSNVVFDGTCGLALSNPLTQNFGGFTIINNQNTAADDLLISSVGCSTCSKIAGAVTVDIYDDTPSHTHAFEIPAVVATNPPFFPNSVGALSFQTLSASPALAGVVRLSHSDSIDFRNNANNADDTITASAADLPLWNGGPWPGSGGGGVTFPLAALQNANNADTILYTRFTDTSPTGFAWRLQNHAASSTLASLDVSGNITANTLTLIGQSTFTLLPTGSVQPFFYAESATAGAANTHPGFYEASASPANAFNTFWFPCTAAGKACLSATTPSADSSQTLVIHGPVNAQTGTTYTIADADEDDLTTYNNAGSIAVTLPCPSGTNFLNGWKNEQQQIGAGNPTITVSGCTINGSSTVVVPATGLELRSDGTNYRALFNGSGGSGPTLQTIEVNNTTQSLLDFDASTANVTGLAVTPSNPSGGKEVMEVSGNLNAANITGTIAASHVANIPLNQVISPTSAPAAYSLAGTWNWALDNSTAATVSTTNATPTAQLCAQYWATGGVSTDSCLGETMSFAAGLNGLATVKFANPATTGGTLFDFSNGGTQSDSLTLGPPTSSTANINGVATIFGSSGGSGIVQVEAGGAGGGLKVTNSSGTQGMEFIPGTVTNGVQQIGITGWAVSNSQIYTVQFKASASVNTGAAVKLDTANAQEIVMTTNADTASPIGIAQQSISANGFGQIIIAGIAGTPTAVKTENTCAIGNDVLVSTVASGVSGNVMCSATPTLGITLGKAMSAATGTAASPATVVVLVQPE